MLTNLGGLDLSRRGLDLDAKKGSARRSRKSRQFQKLKSLDFKNLDREKKNSGLDMMDNLDGFQKLVSTRRTFSISIGLDCRDPQPYDALYNC
jgi:hypothetical protein